METNDAGPNPTTSGRVVPPTELPPTDDGLLDNDFGPSVEACVWSLAILAFGWLVLRLYLKLKKHRGLWWDDHFLAISWISTILSNAFTSHAISLGWGRSSASTTPPTPASWPPILLALSVSGLFSILAAVLSKTSFALTLLRIAGGSGWPRAAVWFAIASVNAVMALAIVFNWVQCTPVQRVFDVFVPGTCWPRQTLIQYNAFAAGYSGAVDVLLALLPWKLIWKMNMSRKERFGAICAMSLGIFAGTISFAKIYAITGTFRADIDSSVQLTVLSVAETSVTIMAASIPILRALARDKAGPKGVKLFTLNATEHVTLQQQPEGGVTTDAIEERESEQNKTAGRSSRRLFTLVRKGGGGGGGGGISSSSSRGARRAPVLSNIIETEELSPRMLGNSTVERSFV